MVKRKSRGNAKPKDWTTVYQSLHQVQKIALHQLSAAAMQFRIEKIDVKKSVLDDWDMRTGRDYGQIVDIVVSNGNSNKYMYKEMHLILGMSGSLEQGTEQYIVEARRHQDDGTVEIYPTKAGSKYMSTFIYPDELRDSIQNAGRARAFEEIQRVVCSLVQQWCSTTGDPTRMKLYSFLEAAILNQYRFTSVEQASLMSVFS